MANRLTSATSPYLLQHADNPVDWFEWGEEAFAAAQDRDVPIFLSVGYSACHWCHVMAHESFEDEEVAALVNDRFVAVKVDREERPDVDAVYMRAVQALTGRGGWPMSVFTTPTGEPFYAGTYWPRRAGHGLPDFPRVLDAVADAWQERRGEVMASAERITATLAEVAAPGPGGSLDLGVTDEAVALLLTRAWDRRHGGFGSAPKFPPAMVVEWLLHHHVRTGDHSAREAAVQALDAMARGGIHDLLGGGFARYSTDERWLVPHFEQMLYDNALLLAAYGTGAAVTGRADFARVTRTTAAFLLEELVTDEGLLASAFDADADGVEGSYSVWPYDEFVRVVGDAGHDAERWASFFGVTPGGNFEGANILSEPVPRADVAAASGRDRFDAELEEVRRALLAARMRRKRPDRDDKVLTDWNALAVRGLVVAGALLDEPAWIEAAVDLAERLHALHVVDGRLQHVSRGGKVAVPGFLDDHALLALADLMLFQVTGDPRWFERGVALADEADRRFHDDEAGGWFQTAHDAEALFARPKETWDNAVPAGGSVMVEVARLLAGLTGEARWRARVEEGIGLVQDQARQHPNAFGWLLRQVEALAAGPREVAIVGEDGSERRALFACALGRVRPGVVAVATQPDHGDAVPLLAGRGPLDGGPAAYVCRELACELPVGTVDELARLLEPDGT